MHVHTGIYTLMKLRHTRRHTGRCLERHTHPDVYTQEMLTYVHTLAYTHTSADT